MPNNKIYRYKFKHMNNLIYFQYIDLKNMIMTTFCDITKIADNIIIPRQDISYILLTNIFVE